MSDLFLNIVNMSISASWLVLTVLLLRFVLKKAPKWVNVLLWGIVAVRLAFPFSIESALSLIPSAETISPGIMMDTVPSIQTGVPAINNVINPVIGSSLALLRRQRKSTPNLDSDFEHDLGGRCRYPPCVYRRQLLASAAQGQ